ncbi:MAG: 2,3-bisphosphoglycerate-independent phosphoglycerate mutase [Thermodesulfobacteriota bacterium]|nr:2,3-bisphosphoglycerate-independent phosphoglycerate mutase [Thermodesulfobacteriota bacterium]
MKQTAGQPPKPVVLTILDGWGLSPRTTGNAVRQANTPCIDQLLKQFPHSTLQASGLAVGLPQGQMGNSEVGHLNIGAGRIVYQDLTRISKSIDDGKFFANPTIVAAMQNIKLHQGKLHLMGLLSDGGVHSLNSHLYALIKMASELGIQEICIHPFLDGRDTPPQSATNYLQQLEEELISLKAGRITTLCGRFYAMDRDNRWERIETAYLVMTAQQGKPFATSSAAIDAAYAAGQTDEFVEPCIIGNPAPIVDGDGIIFFNFRADRAREISQAFTTTNFNGFMRPQQLNLSAYVCMTEYDEQLKLPVAFAPDSYPNILAEVISQAGLQQLHIAETEKYAHVTFFFNGGNETPFAGEKRILIPSPQDVTTYDEKPQMSADQVAKQVVEQINNNTFDLIIINFANPDMVGHTGVMAAAIKAMEAVDSSLQQVVDATLNQNGCLLITSDHGNCEQMEDAQGEPYTAHTTNEVPIVYVSNAATSHTLQAGKLADIAPTILSILKLPQPVEMTGHNLLSPARR